MGRSDSPLYERMVFNVGARRSGTQWLQRIVSSHPDVSAVPSETHLISDGLAPLSERFHHSLRSSAQVGSVYIERDVLLDALRDFTDTVFGGFLEPGTTRLAERTALHARHLPLIHDIYPDARVVHIIRDGRDVARSLVSRDFGPDSLEAAASEWRDTVNEARAAGLSDDRYYELRYESLLLDPREEIGRLFAWLGLTLEEETLNRAVTEAGVPINVDPARPQAQSGKWREAFTAEDIARFDEVAGELLAELGYPPSAGAAVHTRPPRRAERSPRRPTWRRSRRATPDPQLWRKLQGRVDEVAASLTSGDIERVARLCAPDARFAVVTSEGKMSARGEDGRRALADALATLRPFAGRQLRGDSFLSLPTSAVLLSYDGETGGDRLLLIRSPREQIEDLTLYLLPLSGRSH